MSAALPAVLAPGRPGVPSRAWPVLAYCAFAVAVFVAQGMTPPLGPDHLAYIQLAESIRAACPAGDYWREATSVQSFSVALLYLHGWTGSHIVSMKVLLAAFSVLYLLTAHLFFSLVTGPGWKAVLFALVSAFAVSFGIASWGMTDSAAMLPRTLVAPALMFCAWWWLRFDGRWVRYFVFPMLILASTLHLSTWHMAGVLGLAEVIDLALFSWRLRPLRRIAAFAGSLLVAAGLLYALEQAGYSSKILSIQIPEMLRSAGVKIPPQELGIVRTCENKVAPKYAAPAPPPPAAAAPTAPAPPAAKAAAPKAPGKPAPGAKPAPAAAAKPQAPADDLKARLAALPKRALPEPVMPHSVPQLTAKQAWAIELSGRPWRNMPLPLVNWANVFSSSALILLLALGAMVDRWRRGFTRHDRVMAAMFVAVPLFAFGPQTALWVLRTYTDIYPMTIEEFRAIGLIMIPALYFIARLFVRVMEVGGPRRNAKAAALVVAVLALPLLMKNLPTTGREAILSALTATGVVNPSDPARVANARAALGLGVSPAPLYYSTQGVRAWLERHAPHASRIVTDRDDLILLRDRILIGPRQVGAMTYYMTPEINAAFLQTTQAIAARDLDGLKAVARKQDADFIVVPWKVDGAAYSDADFSVLLVGGQAKP